MWIIHKICGFTGKSVDSGYGPSFTPPPFKPAAVLLRRRLARSRLTPPPYLLHRRLTPPPRLTPRWPVPDLIWPVPDRPVPGPNPDRFRT